MQRASTPRYAPNVVLYKERSVVSGIVHLADVHKLASSSSGNDLGYPLLGQRLYRRLDRVHGIAAPKRSSRQVGDAAALRWSA